MYVSIYFQYCFNLCRENRQHFVLPSGPQAIEKKLLKIVRQHQLGAGTIFMGLYHGSFV